VTFFISLLALRTFWLMVVWFILPTVIATIF
jgi:hypothetical protein